MVDVLAAGSIALPADDLQNSQVKQAKPASLSVTVYPTFAEASALLNGRYSCLVLDTCRRHIALPPKYLDKKKTGIRDQLNTELLRYSERLNGVPVAYDDIKIVGELGDIYDDQGPIHLNVEADFVIFRPKAGEKLLGVVNKVAPTHIGCLVHGCFNASIPKPYKMSLEDWQNLGVQINDQLEFEVFRLDSDAVGVFCIRGKFNFESLNARHLNELSDQHTSVFRDADQLLENPTAKLQLGNNTLNGDGESKIEGVEGQSDVQIKEADREMDVLPLQKKTKKKKKKHKHEDRVINGSDPSCSVDVLKTAKKKKRKHPEEDEIPEMSLEPKLKKKKYN